MKKVIMNIVKVFETLILTIGILLCVFVILQKTICKNTGVFGYYTYVIVTNSMEPEINVGDIILVHKVNPNKIKVGDTISYMGTVDTFKDKIIAHEVQDIVVEDNKKIFYTKGINNMATDPAVYEDQIYGKVVHKFITISFVSHLIRSKLGFFALIFLPLASILAFELVNIIMNLKKENKIKKFTDETVILKLPKLKN